MKRFIAVLVCAAAALCAATAGAQEPGATGPLGAAIDIGRYHTGFAIGQGSYGADVTQIGMSLRQHFSGNFSLTMEGGYTDMTLSGDPAAENLTPSGYYGMLTARYVQPLVAHFGLAFTATGGYHRLHDSNSAASVVERWWSYSGAVGARFHVRYFGVEAGAIYRHASGREESSGPTGTRDLGFEKTTNPYVDLTFAVSRGGTFTVHAEGGARRSVALVFGYLFASP